MNYKYKLILEFKDRLMVDDVLKFHHIIEVGTEDDISFAGTEFTDVLIALYSRAHCEDIVSCFGYGEEREKQLVENFVTMCRLYMEARKHKS